jgi:hypothetical protein
MPKPGLPPPFDRLRRDKTYGGYSQRLEHKGQKIEVRFHAETRAELEALLPTGLAFWKSRVRWFKAFREYAATELLTLLNANLDYGQDDFQPVTAAQVRKVLPLPFSVQFLRESDDSDQILFEMDGGEDKETLQENCFEVFGTLEDGITEGDVVTLL